MRQDNSGIKVDGGMSSNDLLCQILADISGSVIVRPKMTEATALGAAMVAGYHLGYFQYLFKELESSDYGSESEPEVPKSPMNGHAMAAHYEHSNGHQSEQTHPRTASIGRTFKTANGLIRSLSRRISSSSLTRKLERSFSISTTTKIYDKNYDVFHPKMEDHVRQDRINTWKAAVSRSRKWIRVEKQEQKRVEYKRLSSIPFMGFVLMSFGTYILSEGLLTFG